MALLHVNFFSDVLRMSAEMDVLLPQQTNGQIGMEGRAADGKSDGLAEKNLHRTLCQPPGDRGCDADDPPGLLYGYHLWNEILDLPFKGAAEGVQGILPPHV